MLTELDQGRPFHALDSSKMNPQHTKEWSESLLSAIAHAHYAHSANGLTPDDAVRFHDRATPYLVHPLWCAASLLQESALPQDLRQRGSVALLWHDTLEDTSLPLPQTASEAIAQLVQDMSFESFEEETQGLWSKSQEVKLLKLYDKVSNLLDGHWLKQEKWNTYVNHTLRLCAEVEQTYGVLNIVKMAKAIAVAK